MNEYPFDDDLYADDSDEYDEEDRRIEPLSIQESLQYLRGYYEDSVILPAGVIYGLSGLSGDSLEIFRSEWPNIGREQRLKAVQFLVELSETNFDLDYEAISYVFFNDEDAEIRTKAIEIPWYVTSEHMFNEYMRLTDDPVIPVRAAAFSGLGRFIYEAEMEEFDAALARQAQARAIARYDDLEEDIEVRRRCLEAVANSSHPRLEEMIEEAYSDPEPMMQVSAIFAMGASCDKRWGSIVLEELDSEAPERLFEAVRAAGELELPRAVPQLATLAYADDYDIKMMSIWSLGEIGTPEARRSLDKLADLAEETEDVDLLEAIEEALGMASLVGMTKFGFDGDDEFYDDFDDYFDDDNDGLN